MQMRQPIWLQRISTPGADAMAILFTFESFSRALLISLVPLEAYRILGDAGAVSLLFFLGSAAGLGANFAVPWLVRQVGRRWVYTVGAVLLFAAPIVLAGGSLPTQAFGMVLRALGVVSLGICLNLYIMDHVHRRDFGRSEPKRIFYSAGAWTLGPALGVYLATEIDPWAAYGTSAFSALALLAYFWFLRISDSPAIGSGRYRASSSRQFIPRFFAQPRLLLAWLISFCRYAWWAMFMIYVPIYAVQSGLGELAGGLIVSLGAGFTFLMPLWGWYARAVGVRRVLVTGYMAAGVLTLVVAVVSGEPWLAAGLLIVAALFMVTIDAVGNMPFMLAVRPRERAEMTTVYATYRDMGEILPPGLFALLLLVFNLPIVFVVTGLATVAMSHVCRRMHPRFGLTRQKQGLAVRA
jgi:MFS family permease